MKVYEVAVVAPLFKTLTYAEPGEGGPVLQAGQRVLVPLGRRLATGYILGPVEDAAGEKGYTVKPVAELLDNRPLFPPYLIPFYRWIAEYYHFPLGEVIRTALPGGLTAGSTRKIRLVPGSREKILHALSGQPLPDTAWTDRLLEKGELTPSVVATLWKQAAYRKIVEKWERNGWITVKSGVSRRQFNVKTQVQVCLSTDLLDLMKKSGPDDLEKFIELCEKHFPGLKKSETRTLSLIYTAYHSRDGAPFYRPELTREYPGAGKALRSLEEKKVLSLEKCRVYRDLFGREHGLLPEPEALTAEQQAVLNIVLPAVKARTFKTFLLHGITGCGKTEVYLQAAAKALEDNRCVLVLVPEIALASQLEAHFYSRFGDRLALLHSGLSTAERHDQWQRILAGRATIVIGARSAVFAPFADLGLIVVDEEHEPAYKQEDGLHYNGRDLAVLRGKFSNCPVLLGSATPSMTSYYHTTTGKYELLEMKHRVRDRQLPEVSIVNLAENRTSRPDLFFSDQLTSALWENMENRQQSLLFVNRRGFASFILCGDCGHIVQCRHCQVSLTMHRREQKLVCHYCGYSITTKIVCPDCGSKQMRGLGLGSERIEEEVRQILPHARVARLDSDTASNRKHFLHTLKAMYSGDVDVLIGTQMIAKGLHFPGLTLVGVVWADSGLGMPDFRASERTFQLLAQVTGRAGRGEHPGRVIIQTYHPGHYSVLHARGHDYSRFYEQEIALRRELQYPPFSRLVNIRLTAKDEKQVEKCARAVGIFLRNQAGSGSGSVAVLGPAPAPLVRIKDRTRWQVLLKGARVAALHALCWKLKQEFKKTCSGKVKLTIDVDPENMM